MRLNHALLLVPCCFLLTTSCSDPAWMDMVDPTMGLDRKDYENMGKNGAKSSDTSQDPAVSLKAKNVVEPSIPDLAEVIAAPKPPKIGNSKLVSIAVTDDVPLKDVLIELSKLADVDMEIDSSISGGITFRAKDRPFNEVIDRIADMAGLRYEMKNNVVRVERDTPFVQTYSIDMLNVDRSSQGKVTVDTSTSSGGGGGGGEGGGGASGATNSGSQSAITAKTDADFWKQFDESIKQILQYQPTMMSSGGAAAPVAGQAATMPSNVFYVINRQASTLTVSATHRQHEVVQNFLEKIKRTSSSQVIIEAKIIEVTLADAFQTGIDWSVVNKKTNNTTISGFNQNFIANGYGDVTSASGDAGEFGVTNLVLDLDRIIGIRHVDLSAAVQLAENFGVTRTLSSPRLTAINNQQAVLTVARNEVFFDVEVESTDAVLDSNGNVTTPAKTTASSEVKTVPIGLILTLQPSIDAESNEVTLSVRPTISRIVGRVEDPGFAINAANANLNMSTFVPIVETRELDSILKIKSGQVMVIGGLMEDNAENNESGIPGANDVPYFGSLFKGHDKSLSKKELVIFIRATIVPSSGYSDPADRAVFETFTNDPRPLNF